MILSHLKTVNMATKVLRIESSPKVFFTPASLLGCFQSSTATREIVRLKPAGAILKCLLSSAIFLALHSLARPLKARKASSRFYLGAL